MIITKRDILVMYLIPPGTTHGHGGNQMVLEMDTVPSIAGTEYSFFMYDFMRPSWDDTTKTMTGKPVKMHLDHGFDMDPARRLGGETSRGKTGNHQMDKRVFYRPLFNLWPHAL